MAKNRPMLTDLPIISVAKLGQKREVQSFSFVPEQGNHLKWVTWNGVIPSDAISINNRYVGRIHYVCKYKCNAGFYTKSKGPYCYFPVARKEYRGFPFAILVNKDDFEILEWKDGSHGSVPSNSVQTCPGDKIYVGKNKYGLGKVSTQDKAFYLPYRGSQYSYKHYQVLTTNDNIINQKIYDVRYNTNNSEVYHFPLEVMRQSTINNYECRPVVKSNSFTKTYQVEKRWDFSSSIMFGATTSIKTGIPFIIEGQIQISTEVTFHITKSNALIESITDTASVELTAPPNHSCHIIMERYKYKVDIPFTARLRHTYVTGVIHTMSVTGTYNNVESGEVRAKVNQCELLNESKLCP